MKIISLMAERLFGGEYKVSAIVPQGSSEAIERLLSEFGINHQGWELTIVKPKNKRSLDANGYLWHLINEIANVLRSSKDEVYLEMLRRYGQSQLIKLPTEGLPILTRAIKYYDIGKEKDNCTYVKVYMGSSDMDSTEMSILIDGVVSEAKELGIETITPDELSKLKGLERR